MATQRIPQKFPNNVQTIPVEFAENSKKIPKKFPQEIPKNCYKLLKNILLALIGRNPFQACFSSQEETSF